MRVVLIIGSIAIMTLALSAADVAGTWKGSMETQGGNVDVTLTFRTGTALAGTALMDQYEGAIEKGTLNGDKIHFEVNIEHGTVTFDGTVPGTR